MSQKSSSNYLPERNMAGKAISDTFRGILRVSNNNELSDQEDIMLNSSYYASSSDNWEGGGEQITYYGLCDDNSYPVYKRYNTKDPYTDLKLPVSDSMGNFLNFSLGSNSTLIGSLYDAGVILPATEQFTTADNTTLSVVNVTNSQTIKIGLSSIALENDKNINGADIILGSSDIESFNTQDSALCIKNYYHHGSNEDNKKFNIISDWNDNGQSYNQMRTIFKTSVTPSLNDAFIYSQESFNLSKNGLKNNKDCIVKVENIENYVNEKLNQYIDYNTSELPSGTIVWQYCSLNKWYCTIEDSKGNILQTEDGRFILEDRPTTPEYENNSFKWQGYRPSMTYGDGYAYWNVLQNDRVCYSQTYLYDNGFNATNMVDEMPPDFKRGYTLCDGKAHTISLVPAEKEFLQEDNSEYTISKNSLDLFFNLFYTIGYHYHNDVKRIDPTYNINSDSHKTYYEPVIRPIIKNNNNEFRYNYANPESEIYTWAADKNRNHSLSREMVYGIDMATILIFREFNKAIQDDGLFQHVSVNGKFNIDKALQWLSSRPIDDEYIFNVYWNNTSKDVYYKYTDRKNKIYALNVGQEINKFSDSIPYFYLTNNGTVINKTECQIYKTAEAYDLARLFAHKLTSGNRDILEEWRNYTFTFYMPKLYSDEDLGVNRGNTYNLTQNYNLTYNNIYPKAVGLFIGSNGLKMADSIVIRNGAKKINASSNIIAADLVINQSEDNKHSNKNINSVSKLKIGDLPHSHAVAKGYQIYGNFNVPVDGRGNYGSCGNSTPLTRDWDPTLINNMIDYGPYDNAYCHRSGGIVHIDPYRVATLKSPAITSNSFYKSYIDLENSNYVSANYHCSVFYTYGGNPSYNMSLLQNDKQFNYIFQDVAEATLREVHSSSANSHGLEFSINGNDKLTWYGRTSEPIWSNNTFNINEYSLKMDNSQQGYFRPESIKLLPLIKL